MPNEYNGTLEPSVELFLGAMESYAAQVDSEVLYMALESNDDAPSASSAIAAFKGDDPDEAMSQLSDSLKVATDEKKKGNYKKVIAISVGVMAAAIAIATIIIKQKTGKFPPQLIAEWVKKMREIKKAKADLTSAESALAEATNTLSKIKTHANMSKQKKQKLAAAVGSVNSRTDAVNAAKDRLDSLTGKGYSN